MYLNYRVTLKWNVLEKKYQGDLTATLKKTKANDDDRPRNFTLLS